MEKEPIWSRCLHLCAGTCPQLMLEGRALTGGDGPRPELSQDMALSRLAQACEKCPLAPFEEKK